MRNKQNKNKNSNGALHFCCLEISTENNVVPWLWKGNCTSTENNKGQFTGVWVTSVYHWKYHHKDEGSRHGNFIRGHTSIVSNNTDEFNSLKTRNIVRPLIMRAGVSVDASLERQYHWYCDKTVAVCRSQCHRFFLTLTWWCKAFIY